MSARNPWFPREPPFVETAHWLAAVLSRPVPGRVQQAGPWPSRAQAASAATPPRECSTAGR